ncbi:hypothetical protein PLICRDRAFT_179839 [Plicaturopsis crispa FD-325 SS-3]|uniref:Enoyl reductase (ER) domain-containing protein n=1 Tax=Plicaturopsis crispa FD-325 SS-3 TaxID=944288 RepID=A0A0C9T4D7_PLICR|nr:hypothetical protein PLICRDRAFT_179839 [Plicaturopsis crispa FD-325 SS-3]
MRAVLIKDGKGPIENLYIGETPKPVPGPGEVLVKIKAFGLNRMDLLQRVGNSPPPPGASDILGVEFSGTVSELGSGVSKWNIDDEVLGLAPGGAYAEYVAVSEKTILKKPAALSWVEAAGIPENFLTAFQAIVRYGEVQEGDNVLVHAGASGVGIASIQLARLRKANTVTATASSTEKLDYLLALPGGATHVANYKTQDFATEVKKTTGGKGVNALVDFVGRTHWHQNIDALAFDGRMTILAFLSGAEVDKVNIRPILQKRLRIQGSTLRPRPLGYQGELVADFASEVLPYISGRDGPGPLKTIIHKVYPWTDIQSATREIDENKNIGKIVAEIV